jgi:hypothetical protein
MKLVTWFKQLVQFFATAIARIFSPTDDSYPASGVQPFEDQPTSRKRHRHRWSW